MFPSTFSPFQFSVNCQMMTPFIDGKYEKSGASIRPELV